MNATQAVIHFIGLVLFTTQVENDPGLHAILPAIRHPFDTPPIASAPPPGVSAGVASHTLGRHIETHAALLIFRRDIIENDSHWKTSRFPPTAGLAQYRYVQLTGEHITFIADAPSYVSAELPPDMPRLSCATPAELTSGYQRPYSEAAAVVDIPEGTMSVCEAKGVAPGRIDTRLTLNTTGTLTVLAVKSGVVKTLVLDTSNNPTIYLANVPSPRLNDTPTAPNGQPHFLAYYGMIGKDQPSKCLVRPTSPVNVPDCDQKPVFKTIPPATNSIPTLFVRVRRQLRAIFFQPSAPGTPTEHFPDDRIKAMANAECSNTQWP